MACTGTIELRGRTLTLTIIADLGSGLRNLRGMSRFIADLETLFFYRCVLKVAMGQRYMFFDIPEAYRGVVTSRSAKLRSYGKV